VSPVNWSRLLAGTDVPDGGVDEGFGRGSGVTTGDVS
jgi:hypothetical protein